jgi:photosystem II protein PsbQ
MFRFRTLISLLLVIVATLLVSCSSPQASIPTTYSLEKIVQLQRMAVPLEEYRAKMSTLAQFIGDRNWTDTRTFIHGPLGQLRKEMLSLSRSLLPKDQGKATELARETFTHFEQIDIAAKEKSLDLAQFHYQAAVKSLDSFLNLIPTTAS